MEAKLIIGGEVKKLTEVQEKFIIDVVKAFMKVERIEKMEIVIGGEDMTVYVIIGKDFLTHKEIGEIYRNLARYEFDISFEEGKIEILVGDY